MITEEQEAAVSEARARARQDKRIPFLIHMDDARLIPNVEKLRKHPKYRIYTGPAGAGEAERKAWLNSMSGNGAMHRAIVTESKPFDISKATVDELVAFASDQYGALVTPDKRMTLDKQLAYARAEVRKLAETHGDLKTGAEDLT